MVAAARALRRRGLRPSGRRHRGIAARDHPRRSAAPPIARALGAGQRDPDPDRRHRLRRAARALAERHFGGWRGRRRGRRPRADARRPAPRAEIDRRRHARRRPGGGRGRAQHDRPRAIRVTIARSSPMRCSAAATARASTRRSGSAAASPTARAAASTRGAQPGPFVATTQTRNDAAAEVLGLILARDAAARRRADPGRRADRARAPR